MLVTDRSTDDVHEAANEALITGKTLPTASMGRNIVLTTAFLLFFIQKVFSSSPEDSIPFCI